jgi:4-alpha-glucanotransferase
VPGTTDRPNWSLPLPVPVEELAAHPLLREVTRILGDGVRPGEPEDAAG